MKRPDWNLKRMWESIKRAVTHNLWLKLLSLLLAAATYSALKEKSETNSASSEQMEAEIYNKLKAYISDRGFNTVRETRREPAAEVPGPVTAPAENEKPKVKSGASVPVTPPEVPKTVKKNK